MKAHTNLAAVLLLSFMVVTLFGMSGCTPAQARSINEGIDQGYAAISAIAEETAIMCGHTVQGGPCAPGAAISTAQKNDVRDRLQQAYDGLTTANTLASSGELTQANSKLEQATAILTVVRALLADAERVAMEE